MVSALDGLGFLLTMAGLMAIGYRHTRKSSEFLIANRAVGLFALIATLVMTEFNTSTLLAFSAAGYVAGPMAISLPLIFLIGLGWYTYSVARAWKKFNGLSVAGFFTQKYGPALGKTASLLLMIAMLGFSATYVKSMTLLFLPQWQGLTPWTLSALLCVVVLIMTISGGLISIIRTDILSFIITLILFPALLLLGWIRNGANLEHLKMFYPPDQLAWNPIAQWTHPALPFWFVTSLIILTMFTYICSPWYGQKIFSAKNEKIAFQAVGISSVLIFVLYGAAVLAASFFRTEPSQLSDPQQVIPAMIQLWLPAFGRGIAYAMLFAAAMTTLSSVWNTIVAMMCADFDLKKFGVNPQRMLTIGLATLSWLGANLLVDNILNRLILANIPIAALSFALLAGFYWSRVSSAGAWTSVIVGCLWATGCYLWFGETGGYTWYWAFYGIPIIFISGIVGSLLKPVKVSKSSLLEYPSEIKV